MYIQFQRKTVEVSVVRIISTGQSAKHCYQIFPQNAVENVSTVPGFFDLLWGIEPNWNWADFSERCPALQSALASRAPYLELNLGGGAARLHGVRLPHYM